MHFFSRVLCIVLLSLTSVSACSSSVAHKVGASTSDVATSSATASALATTTEVAGPQLGQSNGRSYTVRFVNIDGGTTDGTGKWNAYAGLISGGDQGVVDAFNAASQDSVKDLIGIVRGEAHTDGWTLNAKSVVSFQPFAVSQITTGVYCGESAAHPINYISTIVIDSRDAHPITLDKLFLNKQDGLNRISEQIRLIQHINTDGNAPVEKNFVNWIPVDKGLEIHFNDYQSGHGLPVFTVPWSALIDILTPDMRALAHE